MIGLSNIFFQKHNAYIKTLRSNQIIIYLFLAMIGYRAAEIISWWAMYNNNATSMLACASQCNLSFNNAFPA
jgi:hypothetical protein